MRLGDKSREEALRFSICKISYNSILHDNQQHFRNQHRKDKRNDDKRTNEEINMAALWLSLVFFMMIHQMGTVTAQATIVPANK
ncbi:hypothetical protein BK140_26065 [Paenibacillus macerans]|nr:hypothetical protein BK140_26065 [Paenibacillus macerans]